MRSLIIQPFVLIRQANLIFGYLKSKKIVNYLTIVADYFNMYNAECEKNASIVYKKTVQLFW